MTHVRSSQSEAGFQQQVISLAIFNGWKHFHPADNRPVRTRSGRVMKQHVVPGFPDLVLLRGPELIFAELKTQTGRVRPEQRDWIAGLQTLSDAVGSAVGNLTRNAFAGLTDTYGAMPAVDVYVWRPSDFDEINARLSRRPARAEYIHRGSAA